MIFLNHHLTWDWYFVGVGGLGVAPVAQVRSACPDSAIPALSDGNQHLEYQFLYVLCDEYVKDHICVHMMCIGDLKMEEINPEIFSPTIHIICMQL